LLPIISKSLENNLGNQTLPALRRYPRRLLEILPFPPWSVADGLTLVGASIQAGPSLEFDVITNILEINQLKARYVIADERRSSNFSFRPFIRTALVVLLVTWLGGFTVFHMAGGLINLLLVFAVIALILHFVIATVTVMF
jgi:hypothetical protein